jgi:hypothetical protein
MNADHDEKEQELQRMLALKRHETPPPRYFRSFSERVSDRLNTPEPDGPLTFWQRLGLDIDGRPVLVCASGVAVCSLLVVGLVVSLRVTPPKPAPPTPGDQTHRLVAPPPSSTDAPQEQPVPTVVAAPPLYPVDDPVTIPASFAPQSASPPAKK